MNYYDHKLRKHTADIKPYFYTVICFAIICIIGLVGKCEHEETLPELPQANRTEVMYRQTEFEKEQHLDLADKCLTAKVERK